MTKKFWDMKRRNILWLCLLIGSIVTLLLLPRLGTAQDRGPVYVIDGDLQDSRGEPVEGAEIKLMLPGEEETIAEAESQKNGQFELIFGEEHLRSLAGATVAIERPHFRSVTYILTSEDVDDLQMDGFFVLPAQEGGLQRRITPAFWIAGLIFISVLLIIATERLHNVLAVMAGVAAVLFVSYFGRLLSPDLFIFNFERALDFIDWEVIFLVMGMMIVIAVIERTGIFQWVAYQAYRISRGRAWLLALILMIFTGIASAMLDNVTTMLLMTPITIQIALGLNLNPLPLLLPQVWASNVAGISTLIGTPTNILIGSYADISFSDFMINLTPGVIMAMTVLILYVLIVYWKDLKGPTATLTPELQARLQENARIRQPEALRKALIIGAFMMLMFLFGEALHLVPAVTAVVGATALLIWIRPNIEEMIEAVDWTTLVFFMMLFIMVGAIEEVGLIGGIAELIGDLVGTNLTLAMILIVWLGAIISGLIDNIPFAAAMLPVVGYLSSQIPGAAESKALFYALSVGAAFGGNGTLIGASANLVTAGISERAGFPITYGTFLRRGFPAMIVTAAAGTVWLLIRF
ncbi:MAG: ArsB/NhaD family transporter [Chloroflexota bacterium]|nr:ArsB/NhaD family transporter [Chloroflexota bacterium]